ncbi:DUF2459 domain-containing protein [Rhizosaccharibacter radicis]|uniref:DUF2459 domain-containing protein n=1 Tax=Rhizosaccharibacter radicis TaxID=2782605 RepID=A0ABT1VT84_9PROT|nr:DUF2459 domain-containing protein [Acetobacteraceae bacterium KSS12]
MSIPARTAGDADRRPDFHRVRRGPARLTLAAGLCALLAACAGRPLPVDCAALPPPPPDRVFLVAHGWHTDLAIPASLLRGRMRVFRSIFPGMRVLLLGFGKRTFMMAPVTTVGDLLVGPFPGSGTVLAVGLSATPDVAYDDGTMEPIRLPPGGADALSEFLWNTLEVRDDRPVRIGPGFFPGSVFFASRRGYSGFDTCNRWSVDALRAAGLPVSGGGVVFASQALRRAAPLSDGLCAIKGRP